MATLNSVDEAFDRGILVAEMVIFPQVLPDTLGGKSSVYPRLDDTAIWLAGTGWAGGHPGQF